MRPSKLSQFLKSGCIVLVCMAHCMRWFGITQAFFRAACALTEALQTIAALFTRECRRRLLNHGHYIAVRCNVVVHMFLESAIRQSIIMITRNLVGSAVLTPIIIIRLYCTLTRGVQKVRRLTQLTTRYAHHILSLFDIFLWRCPLSGSPSHYGRGALIFMARII